MLTTGFELVADKADAVEVGAHRELLVLGLGLLGARRALCQRLGVQCKGKDYIASDFTGVQRAVETT
jgi:hypothetical protein